MRIFVLIGLAWLLLTVKSCSLAQNAWAQDPAAEGRDDAYAYAAAAGWPAGPCTPEQITFTFVDLLPHLAGQAFTDELLDGKSQCRYEVDVEYASKPCLLRAVAMHEVLHLIRDDGWHDPDPHGPLYWQIDPLSLCYAPATTTQAPEPEAGCVPWREGRAVMRARFPKHRYRVQLDFSSVRAEDECAEVRQYTVRRRRGARPRRVRYWYLTRPVVDGPIVVTRGTW